MKNIHTQEERKHRGLGITAMIDRAQQVLHPMALDPVAETILDNETFGFRTKRSNADATEAVYKVVANRDCAEWIIEGDIKVCIWRNLWKYWYRSVLSSVTWVRRYKNYLLCLIQSEFTIKYLQFVTQLLYFLMKTLYSRLLAAANDSF